ncbi:competence protein CoiA family protein [Streptomyces canus]|uniref:competence protein CoiA family protein n=1 Tax=Streptomyces canus TaxID=58343 RepID=UPI003870BE0A
MGEAGGYDLSFTARHAVRGLLDATLADLGCAWSWDSVHRVRPRVDLVCPECAHRVHAKVSPRGTRYFAHDPSGPNCAMAGESLEHHLLKLELATVIRAAGHQAQLEVRGPGGHWRADVLSSSPDGAVQMAWEVQLSAIPLQEIHERTQRFADDGVGVCWVSTLLRPWHGAVPSIMVTAPPTDDPDWQVTAGPAFFEIEECYVHEKPWQCPLGEHGFWHHLEIKLSTFVRQVLEGGVVVHQLTEQSHLGDCSWSEVWSSPHHIAVAARFGAAEREGQQRQARESLEWRARKWPEANRILVQEWQESLPEGTWQALQSAVAEWIRTETGKQPSFRPQWVAWNWACGVPVCVDGRPYGVIHPDPSKVEWKFLTRMVIFVPSDTDRQALFRSAPEGTHVVTLLP